MVIYYHLTLRPSLVTLSVVPGCGESGTASAKASMYTTVAVVECGCFVQKFLGVIAFALLVTGPASGADFPAKVPPATYYNWSGFYVGGHIGAGSGTKEW